tara:strand:+ start:40 stop:1257 length:1218 start_codon:yes stop_codon:yes gene_type:complete
MSNRRNFLKAGVLATAAITAPTRQPFARNFKGEVKSYKRLGRTNLKVSDISFGTSRLRSGEEHLIHHAIDRGINYFDSAEGYTRGQAEKVLGNALTGKRDQVYLVSKTMIGPETKQTEMMERLEKSLKSLKTDYVDIYMNHAVNDVKVVANPEWLSFIELAKKQGKIRFTGISGHGGYLVDCINYALDQDMIDIMLTAYNFGQDPKFYEGLTRRFDWIATQEALPKAISRAKDMDVGVIAMKTLMGARLNDMRPYEQDGSTYSQAAFKWVLSNDEVDALVITMKTTEDIDEFLAASGSSQLSRIEDQLLKQYAKLNGMSYCKQVCNSCEGSCPAQVPIADVMRTRMYAIDYKDIEFAKDEYALLESDATSCLTCSGEPCKNACPKGVDISKWCAPTHKMLTRQIA